jgi:hypothetical protein
MVQWHRSWKKWRWPAFLFCAIAITTILVAGVVTRIYEFWDKDPQRGATTVTQDVFGDSFSSVRYLDQGWKPEQSLWFYTTPQGSNLLPYDFFLALEREGTTELFRSNENMNRYRYLPQRSTFSNPDGLPVGFVKDGYRGKAYLGLNCSACHTGQVNYKGTAIRIDGGPGGADMDSFMHDLDGALRAAIEKADVHARFVKRVLDRGNLTEKEINDGLQTFSQRVAMYNVVNRSATRYGYARLDAFGRIYNRVLEHIMDEKKLKELLKDEFADDELHQVLTGVDNVLSDQQRDHVVERIAKVLTPKQQLRLRNRIYNTPDAPVSYPFLWDIAQHDYVQWNGLGANAGVGPIGRNSGEVIGVFGTLDWEERPGFSLSSLIGGWGLRSTHISFNSSINVRNLRRIESQLHRLNSPQWPEDILPPIDKARKARGGRLFNRYCASCHEEIARADPNRRVVATIARVGDIGTDPTMATNAATYTGWSGLLRNQYLTTDVGDVLLDERAPVVALLTKATLNVVATPKADTSWLVRGAYWLYDLATAFGTNEIHPSIRRGNYDPDTTADPFASLRAYKARSLNGIWATAPYLHNGSVPTLYDLMLPKKRSGDPDSGEYRPDIFEVGSREFDPVKVGLKTAGYEGFHFNAVHKGNDNGGHEYGTRCRQSPCGDNELPPLTREERLDLLEYLKSL